MPTNRSVLVSVVFNYPPFKQEEKHLRNNEIMNDKFKKSEFWDKLWKMTRSRRIGFKFKTGWDKPYLRYLFEKYFFCTDNLRILDVGCGLNDNFKSYFNNSNNCLFNFDISREALLGLQRSIYHGAVPINVESKFIQGTVTDLPFRSNYFDLVLCVQCLHYFSGGEKKKSLSEIIRVCKEGGCVILSVKNKYSPQALGFKVLQRLYPPMFPLPFFPFTYKELIAELGKLQLIEIFGVIKIPKINYSLDLNLSLNKLYGKTRLALLFGMDIVLIAKKSNTLI